MLTMRLQFTMACVLGVVIGSGATLAWQQTSGQYQAKVITAPSVEQALIRSLQQEINTQRLENQWLTQMIRAGMQGDIKNHMALYRQQSNQKNSQQTAHTLTQANAPADTQQDKQANAQNTPKKVDAKAFIQRIHRAEIALQKQALAEGWAHDIQLRQARQELWQEAKDTLTETEYMQGLAAISQPNYIYFGYAKTDLGKAQGLTHGDVLLRINGIRVYNRVEMNQVLADIGFRSDVNLEFERQGEVLTVTLPHVLKHFELYSDVKKV